MPKNKINDLRDHLFETLEALKNEKSPMDLDRARAVAEVAKVIIETAKVEVGFLKIRSEAAGTGFMRDDTLPTAPVGRQLKSVNER